MTPHAEIIFCRKAEMQTPKMGSGNPLEAIGWKM